MKQNRTPRALCSLIVVLCGCMMSCERVKNPTGPINFVLISVDTLRADHVSAYGYERPTTPRIDRLATQGVRFADSLVPRSETWPALTSILTGTHPRTHGVRTNGLQLDASQKTLIEQLADSGYTTSAFLTNMTTAPNRGIDHLRVWPEPESPQPAHHVADAEATKAARQWLHDHADDPFALWLHLLGPHEPYEPDPKLPRRHATGYEGDITASRSMLVRSHRSRRPLEPQELAHIISLYDDEVSAVDTHVGSLIAELDALGLADDTLVVFTADHGEELRDHDFYFLHSYSLARSVLWTPLILRLPNVLPAGLVVDDLVEAVDIAPTVLSLLGLPIPSNTEGVDLSALAKGEGPHPRANPIAYAELGPEIYALQTRRWKYIHNPKKFTSPGTRENGSGYLGFFRIESDELYDLSTDPGEHHNVASRYPEVVSALRKHLVEWKTTGQAPTPAAAMTPESRAELKALGYIEDVQH